MTSPTRDPTARYDRAVERECAAWEALQLHKPGSPGRAEAWLTWTQAISHTNSAWRELNRNGPNLTQPPDGISTANL
jgi:ferric-dicitrate binding protein FerR (iron transport regulator)